MKKEWLLTLWIVFLTLFSCVSVPETADIVYLPELDESQIEDASYREGIENLQKGKPDAAIESFRQSSADEKMLYLGYGYAYLYKKHYMVAERNFQQVLEMDPDNLDARIGLILLSERSGNPEELYHDYSRLISRYPENKWLRARFETLKKEGKEYYLKKARRMKEDYQDERYIYFLEKARIFFDRPREINLKISRFYREKGKFERALSYYQEVIGGEDAGDDVIGEAAAIYEEREEYDEALILYQKLLERNPDDVELANRVNRIRRLLYESSLPAKVKGIFFKQDITREDLAVLIGHYFKDQIGMPASPVIVSDIPDSSSREYVIKVCSTGIMKLAPDHSFDLHEKVSRADFSNVLQRLIRYLESKGFRVNLTARQELVIPKDIPRKHQSFSTILMLINLGIMELDEEGRFHPAYPVKPDQALSAIKRIRYELEQGAGGNILQEGR